MSTGDTDAHWCHKIAPKKTSSASPTGQSHITLHPSWHSARSRLPTPGAPITKPPPPAGLMVHAIGMSYFCESRSKSRVWETQPWRRGGMICLDHWWRGGRGRRLERVTVYTLVITWLSPLPPVGSQRLGGHIFGYFFFHRRFIETACQ